MKTSRLVLAISPRDKDLLKRADEALGLTLSAFVPSSSLLEAKQVLRSQPKEEKK